MADSHPSDAERPEGLATRYAPSMITAGTLRVLGVGRVSHQTRKFGLIDYEKMFCPDPETDDIFELRGVNRELGCMVVVHPDQYVSHVPPLDAHETLANFFATILRDHR